MRYRRYRRIFIILMSISIYIYIFIDKEIMKWNNDNIIIISVIKKTITFKLII